MTNFQNSSYFYELLSSGNELHESERIALYKYLLESKRESYKSDACKLIESLHLESEIADGEMLYKLMGNTIYFGARRKGKLDFHENLRSLQLSRFSKLRIRRIIQFFAQCEVDVIWNYPLQNNFAPQDGSFTSMTYPYFDYRYFSEGKGPFFGFINKFRSANSEILHQLKNS